MLRNVSLEICLYCGLDAPNTDLMYVLVSSAISTIPVRGLYMISLRARRALLSGVAAETAAVFFVLLMALIGRLYYLQVYQGEKYKMLADENRISTRQKSCPTRPWPEATPDLAALADTYPP